MIVSPSTYSMTKKWWPSTSPASIALTTLLWESFAAILASRSNRWMNSLFWARASRRTLTATMRSTLVWRALYTMPIDPSPSFSRIW